MPVFSQLPESWKPALAATLEQPYVAKLEGFLETERAAHAVYPPEDLVFSALELTPFEAVRVLIVGQDPYHGAGQAHGLAFSVQPGVRVPPSLANMYRELETDLGVKRAGTGFLEPWARQGVLLLNTSLTVRAGEAGSHKGKGWETFTDAVIAAVAAKPEHVVFVLWGAPAQKKLKLIDTARHTVIQSAHPSPLSAHNGFFGSKPFSKVNAALREHGQPDVDWSLAAHGRS